MKGIGATGYRITGSWLVAGKGKCQVGVCKFIRRTFKSKMAMGAILCEEEVTKECVGKIESKLLFCTIFSQNWRM